MFYIKIAFTVLFTMWFYDGLKQAAADRREMKRWTKEMGLKNPWHDWWLEGCGDTSYLMPPSKPKSPEEVAEERISKIAFFVSIPVLIWCGISIYQRFHP